MCTCNGPRHTSLCTRSRKRMPPPSRSQVRAAKVSVSPKRQEAQSAPLGPLPPRVSAEVLAELPQLLRSLRAAGEYSEEDMGHEPARQAVPFAALGFSSRKVNHALLLAGPAKSASSVSLSVPAKETPSRSFSFNIRPGSPSAGAEAACTRTESLKGVPPSPGLAEQLGACEQVLWTLLCANRPALNAAAAWNIWPAALLLLLLLW
mmetsp:Transcript_85122/g.214621  ORF Transcript_85122/g.214621 Transcript_85122/m.214621 type:complete len:206 (+) Transcript_85122:648-1265(+)